jgi:NAD(P)H-dependent nitrite reductase small subunit
VAQWIDVCSEDDLQADSGVCALVDKTQVALFYMPKENVIYAVNNYDPFSKVHVLSRGLIGDIKGEPMVSSPIYKQHFNLETGQCFEDETVSIDTYAVRNEHGRIEVSLTE